MLWYLEYRGREIDREGEREREREQVSVLEK